MLVVVALILGLFPAFAPPALAGPASPGPLPAAFQDGASPIRFEFRYNGGTPEFHQAIEAAGGVWSNHLLSPVPVRVDVTFSALGAVLSDRNVAWKVQNGTWQAPAAKLASASGDPVRRIDTSYAPAPLEEAIRGENLNGDDADITMTINTNMDWYTGLDGRVPADRHDLVSVIMHELGHGLGFSVLTTVRRWRSAMRAGITTSAS
jgi:hypothetical protein